MDIKNLLNRKTVRNFLPRLVDQEILRQALRVAHRTPTSLNSRPVILCDISRYQDASWIAHQQAAQTAPHLFLLAFSEEVAEKNAWQTLALRCDRPTNDTKVQETFAKIVPQKSQWALQQVYLTAGYFAAVLEASGISGCFIAGFDKKAAEADLKIPKGYKLGLVFACGYADPVNPGWQQTEGARSFQDFFLEI